METKNYSVKTREQLDNIIRFDGNYYEDSDIIIDVLGFVNLNKPIELEEGEADPREPVWSDYLFNVFYKGENRKELFSSATQEFPTTPFRKFL